MKDFAKSLEAYSDRILAHCKYKVNTSFLEEMNNKIKGVKRIAFSCRDITCFFLKIRGAFL